MFFLRCDDEYLWVRNARCDLPLASSQPVHSKTQCRKQAREKEKYLRVKAHQYLIRESKNEPVPDGVSLDLKQTVVKPCDRETAKRIILEYEWLGSMPAVVMFTFGIYFGDVCGGVVVFSNEYGENLGVWDKYNFSGKIIVLARGACASWTPKNTASRLIQKAIKQLPPKYEVVTATVDELAGEIGTIYQACSWHYVGVMRKEGSGRIAYRIDGKLVGERTLRQLVGSQKKSAVLAMFPNAERVVQVSKARYFHFRKNEQAHLQAIQDLVKPYPKRISESA